MQHRSWISALVLLLLGAALIVAACSSDSRPDSDPTPTVVDGNDSQSQASGDAAPATTAEPSTGPDSPAPTDGTPTEELPTDDPPAQDAADGTEPQPDEPEPEPDPWASRRGDLLIELTDPVDVDLLREFGRIVGERRGLELLEEVPVYLIRRADLGTYFNSLYDEDDIEEAEFAEAIYRILRIIDPQLDYRTLLQGLYTGLVLGLYDDDIGAFIIVSDNDHISRRDLDTIAHEFVHALQDQHFDLQAQFDSNDGSTDAASAYRFVIEGDARLSENLFNDLIRQFAGDLDATLDRLPGAGGVSPTLRRIFDAPYIDGVSAVARIIAKDGPNAVDPYLLDPPASTEQLLHPDKLAAREPPLQVDAPDLEAALGAGWTWLGSDTLGEYVLRATLQEGVGRAEATRAGAGWGGDRLSIYRHEGGAELLAWHLRWDSPAEAAEFQAAAEGWIRAIYSGAAERTSDGAFRLSGDAVGVWLITADDSTWLLIGDDAGALKRATGFVRSLMLDAPALASSAAAD